MTPQRLICIFLHPFLSYYFHLLAVRTSADMFLNAFTLFIFPLDDDGSAIVYISLGGKCNSLYCVCSSPWLLCGWLSPGVNKQQVGPT